MVNLQLRTRDAKVGGGVVSVEVLQRRTFEPRLGWASIVWAMENRGTKHFKGRAMGGNI